jgi:hypothetical protein
MSRVNDGSCHCRAIGFQYQVDTSPDKWSIRACQCSFCRAHDALSTSDPAASIGFFAREPQHLQRYRFGLRTKDFLLCAVCGVYIGATIKSGAGRFGIINTHALVPIPTDLAAVQPMVYDNEDMNSRIARREERWSTASLSAEID